MIVPFRTLHLFQVSTPPCTQLACVSQVLDDPILRTVPVVDTIGIEYAFDLELTQGGSARRRRDVSVCGGSFLSEVIYQKQSLAP